jgi:hypothetical protein
MKDLERSRLPAYLPRPILLRGRHQWAAWRCMVSYHVLPNVGLGSRKCLRLSRFKVPDANIAELQEDDSLLESQHRLLHEAQRRTWFSSGFTTSYLRKKIPLCSLGRNENVSAQSNNTGYSFFGDIGRVPSSIHQK